MIFRNAYDRINGPRYLNPSRRSVFPVRVVKLVPSRLRLFLGRSASCVCSMESATSQKKSLSDAEAESGVYKTVEFRIYCFKVLPCSKRFCHDWTSCPFAHPGEKARRRDPRLYPYKGIACPEMKMGLSCPRGSSCCYAHNVFEYWLHPNRYRTQPCNDGPRCHRRVCFFAHTLEELRVPTEEPERTGSTLDESSLSDEPATIRDVEQLLSYDSQYLGPYSFGSDPSNKGTFGCDADPHACRPGRSHSFPLASQATLFLSSLASSFLTQFPKPIDDLAEKPPHLEKALTDLLNTENDVQQQRLPLSSFNFVNCGTSALESGLHWNGGPPKLFVDRSQSVANSLGRRRGTSSPTDVENAFLDSVVISQPSKLFSLASQATNF